MNHLFLIKTANFFFKAGSSKGKIESVSTTSLKIHPTIKSFFEKHMDLFHKIPNLYIKGGGARSTLIKFILDSNIGNIGKINYALLDVNDIDIVLIGEIDSTKLELLKNIIDHENIDMEEITSMEIYFETRDMSFNEVLLRPDIMFFTRRAANDTYNKFVKPTKKSYNKDEKNITPKACLRAVLFSLQTGMKIKPANLNGLYDIPPKTLLVYLTKAFNRNIADEFWETIKPWLPEGLQFENPFIAFDELSSTYPNIILDDEGRKKVNSEFDDVVREYYEDKYGES